jgi:hypothetical protein
VPTPEQEFFERLQGYAALKPTVTDLVDPEAVRTEPDLGTPVTMRNFLTHHDTHPILLDLAMVRAFQLSWLGWEPETLWSEIQGTFGSPISELTRAKLQTIRTLHVSNSPWEQWQVFEKVIQGLNNNIPRWDLMQVPGLEQLYAGVDMIDHIRRVDFAPEVRLYIAAAVLNDDVTYVPPPLDFVQVEVSQPYYHCKDCGNEDSALFSDGVCDTCTQKFSPEQGLSMLPKMELIQAGKGKNVDLRLRFNPDAVEERLRELDRTDVKKIEDLDEDNPVDVQVRKIQIARSYMNLRRRQLVEQITSLRSWLESA